MAPEDVEMEDLNYYYANYSRCVLCSRRFRSIPQRGHLRIYNDVITLRRSSGFM